MLLPQAIAVNFSYMLPAASSSNAVVFGTGHLTLKDMVITVCLKNRFFELIIKYFFICIKLINGLILKIVGLGILFLGSTTWLLAIFKEIKIPLSNSTFIVNSTDYMISTAKF